MTGGRGKSGGSIGGRGGLGGSTGGSGGRGGLGGSMGGRGGSGGSGGSMIGRLAITNTFPRSTGFPCWSCTGRPQAVS
ncbi:MAG TPA: hypothetical protein EYP85_04815 [Armatimonadetes bacterium]|nr:hypothetical protein [Armatimonadota bacterium]